jgi:1,4-dihydroxy-2-naphthoyl-CoA synthase
VLLIALNRPAKRNAFNVEMIEELGRAYERLETDDDLRVGVLYATGATSPAAWTSPRSARAWPRAGSTGPRTRATPGTTTAGRGRSR